MNFSTAVSTCLSKYATFSGRASRSEFWWFSLFTFLVPVGVGILIELIHARETLLALVHLALLLPSLAVGARRLHDIGRSGWWLLLMLLPVIGILVLIYWWVQPSVPGRNLHGDSPVPATGYPLD